MIHKLLDSDSPRGAVVALAILLAAPPVLAGPYGLGDLFVADGERVWHIDADNGNNKDIWIPNGIGGSTGITFGPDGHLYASAPSGVRIFDGTTGEFLEELQHPDINGPQYLKFSPDHEWLYVPNFVSGKLVRMSASDPSYAETLPFTLDGMSCVEFGSDGTLYIGEQGTNQVWEYDPGVGLTALAAVPAPRDMKRGPNGNLYVTALSAHGLVTELDASGSIVRQLGGGGLVYAVGLEFDLNGEMFVTNHYEGNVLQLSPDGSGGYGDTTVFASGLGNCDGMAFNYIVPEPATLAQSSLSALALLRWRRASRGRH